jgi:hypothetical protein
MKMGLFTCDVAMRCTWGVFRWEFIFVDITCVCSSQLVGFGSVVAERLGVWIQNQLFLPQRAPEFKKAENGVY